MKPIIEAKALTHTYSAGTPFEHKAIDNVELQVMPGEFLGIIGHTGSGKSTLIQHLNGLLCPTDGQILLDGEDIWAKPKEIRKVRFQVGLDVPQVTKVAMELQKRGLLRDSSVYTIEELARRLLTLKGGEGQC